MLALFVARLEDPSQRLIVAVLLIALGTAMASYGEVNMNWLGLTFMFASETFEAIRLVMTQMLLVGLKFHPSELSDSDAAEVCMYLVGLLCPRPTRPFAANRYNVEHLSLHTKSMSWLMQKCRPMLEPENAPLLISPSLSLSACISCGCAARCFR